MIEWFFSLSELLCTSVDTSFIIACDINNKGSKKFASFKSLKLFERFYSNEQIKNYYEVICTNNKSKLYIDLDIHNVTLYDSQNILKKLLNELESFCLMHSDVIPKYEVSNSHSETKKSYHITCNNIILINQKQRFLFSEEFSKYLSADLKEYFDCSVYSKNRCFRLLESSKFGQNRPLIPCEGSSNNLLDHCVFLGRVNQNVTELKFDEVQYRNDVKITNTPKNIDKILDSIDVKYWTERTSWVQLAAAMKNSGLSFE